MPNLKLSEAARIWGISKRTAYRIAEAGLVRVARFGRRCLTVPEEEVERVRLKGAYVAPRLPTLAPPKPGRRRGSTTN
jgi:predicted site-specific integrase-resolvase